MFKLDNIKFTPQDILHKQFKERNIGKDYDTYNKELERLNDENERLRAKVDELNRQVEVGSSMSNQTASRQPVSSATNMDILKRLSNLERRVFGSQLDGNDNNDSHLL
mgnify:CR=1 FL=1